MQQRYYCALLLPCRGFPYLSLNIFMKSFLFALFLLTTVFCNAQSPDETAIRKLMQTQTEAWNRADLEGIMQTYWQSDSLTFIGKRGITHGWQQTLENYKKSYPDKAAMGTLSFDIIEVKKLSDEYYYVTGGWKLQRATDAP